MDATSRRSLGRIPAIAAFLVLCVAAVAHAHEGGPSLGHLHRRGPLYLRQEGTFESPAPSATSTPPIEFEGPTFPTPNLPTNTTELPLATSTSASPTDSTFDVPTSSPTSPPAVPEVTGDSTVIESSEIPLESEPNSTILLTSTSDPSPSPETVSSTTIETNSSTEAPAVPPTPTSTQVSTSTTSISFTPLNDPTGARGPGNPQDTQSVTSDPPEGTESALPVAIGASANAGFWDNKVAVAATFVVVALVALGLGTLLLIKYLNRRRNDRLAAMHDRIFGEKYFDNGATPLGSARNSDRGIVYDDSRFQGAEVTSAYPFAETAAISSASQQMGQSRAYSEKCPTPSPNRASPTQAHASKMTGGWTPDDYIQPLTPSEMRYNAQRAQYTPPSQSQPQSQAPPMAGAVTVSTGIPSKQKFAPRSSILPVPQVARFNPLLNGNGKRVSSHYSVDSFYGGTSSS